MKRKGLRIIITLVCAMLLVPVVQTEAASSKNKKALAAYRELLLQNQIAWSDWSYAPAAEVDFAVADINKDGVKELILQWQGASHAEGWDRIYTYKKGKIKSLGQFTEVKIYRNKNYFVDVYMGMGNVLASYYRLKKNGKKECIAKYQTSDMYPYPIGAKGKIVKKYSETFGYDVYYYAMKVNGEKVGYKECMKKIRGLEKNAKQLSLTYYNNTWENIAAYL